MVVVVVVVVVVVLVAAEHQVAGREQPSRRDYDCTSFDHKISLKSTIVFQCHDNLKADVRNPSQATHRLAAAEGAGDCHSDPMVPESQWN